MGIKILISDIFDVEALAHLRTIPNVEIIQTTPQAFDPEHLQDVDAWILRSRTNVDERALAQANKLRLVVTATSGFDHFDFTVLKARNVAATFTPTANAESAAQLTLGLMLSLSRGLHLAHHAVMKQQWREQVPRGFLLNGKTVGLIGLGRVGSRVAELLKPFDVKLLAFDPYVDNEKFIHYGVERVGRSEIFIAADIISFHVPLTKETKHLVNHATLRAINPDCYVVNTSRGGVINENELAEALGDGLIKGAALDVCEKEPLPGQSPLRGRSNVLITPHIGAYTAEAMKAASMEAAEKVISFFKGQEIADLLPDSVPWHSQIGTFQIES